MVFKTAITNNPEKPLCGVSVNSGSKLADIGVKNTADKTIVLCEVESDTPQKVSDAKGNALKDIW